jgi:hypothetical protein
MPVGIADCDVQGVQRFEPDRVDVHVGLHRVERCRDFRRSTDEERMPCLGEKAPIPEQLTVAAIRRVLYEHVEVVGVVA